MKNDKLNIPEKGQITYNAEQKLFDVVTCLDYNKIHSVMDFLNWTWLDTARITPEPFEIRATAHNILREAYDKFWDNYHKNESLDEFFISTGGLKASYVYFTDTDVPNNDRDHFSLCFILEEAYS